MAPEAAEIEFTRFAKLWDVETDATGMGEDDVESFEKAKRPIVRGFCEGWLTCDDEGRLTFALKFSKKLIADGIESVTLDPAKADVLAMDKYKDREPMHKLRAYTAAMSGLNLRDFGRIDGRDDKRVRAAILLFLG
jgi:hypothetical protein